MKLFKSLLVAPATIALLTPFSAFAGETNLNDISKYSNLEHLDLANAFVSDEPNQNSLVAGGEGLVETDSFDG
ncbi:porin, partial [Prochlorococcus marinus str. MU1414]|nr:porin [Prochlorococcus marinus str. MU1414]